MIGTRNGGTGNPGEGERTRGDGDADRTGGGVRLAAGVVLFAGGVVAALVPGPFPARLPGATALVGVVATVAGLRAVRGIERPGPARTPDVEALPRVPVPGSTFDRTLAAFLAPGEEHLLYPRRVRTALTNAAVEVLARYRGLTPATARDRVRDGEWTGDRTAAAFLAEGDAPGPEGGPPGSWLRRRASSFDRGVRHAVAAVADVAGVEVGSPASLGRIDSGESGSDRPPVRVGRGEAGNAGPGDGDPRGSATANRSGRWAGFGAVTLGTVGAGALAGWPGVVLAGAVALGYAAAAAGLGAPDPTLSVERTVSTTDPDPGEAVAVTVTVANEGDRTVPDLRVVDGVPGGLAVTEGSPRWAGPLRPGRSVTVEYAVAARRGRHEFDPLLAVARDALGAGERTVRVEGDGETITCVPPPASPDGAGAIRAGNARYAGRVPTDGAGEGVEFHAVREYRRGDPLTRIDWNHLARRGELAAREFRRERATTAVVVVDARPAAYLAPGPGRAHAVDRSVAAARRVVAALAGSGNRVGVAAIGRSECWVPPGSGADHRARVRRTLATHPALSSVPPGEADDASGGDGNGRRGGDSPLDPTSDDGIGPPGTAEEGDLTDPERRRVRRLRTRLPAGAQVVLCSPVADPGAVRVARDLSARGHPVTVIAPDPTSADTATRALARIARVLRLAELRDGGPTVVDWPAGTPLAVALARARRSR